MDHRYYFKIRPRTVAKQTAVETAYERQSDENTAQPSAQPSAQPAPLKDVMDVSLKGPFCHPDGQLGARLRLATPGREVAGRHQSLSGPRRLFPSV